MEMVEDICKHCKHCLSCLCGDEFKDCRLKKSPSERDLDFGEMLTIEERAKAYRKKTERDVFKSGMDISTMEFEYAYKQGATEQEEHDIKVLSKVYADLLSAKGYDIGTINSELARLQKEIKEE